MIIFIYGEDNYRSRQKLNEFKDKFKQKFDQGGENLVVLNGETATMEKINELISPSSLFSKRRLIVIENLFLNKDAAIFEKLLNHIKNKKLDVASTKDDDNIIIFYEDSEVNVSKAKAAAKINSLFDLLKKQKFSYAFPLLSNMAMTDWIKKETEARGGKISQNGAMILSSLLGNNIWQISNEIDKLINYKAIIELVDIELLTRGKFDEKIFALTDAISNKNKKDALKLLEEQLEAGLSDVYLLTMITRQFKILLQIRYALDKGIEPRQISAHLKLNPFVAQKGTVQARNFTFHILKDILNKLIEIDYQMKNGEADIETAISLLIAKL